MNIWGFIAYEALFLRTSLDTVEAARGKGNIFFSTASPAQRIFLVEINPFLSSLACVLSNELILLEQFSKNRKYVNGVNFKVQEFF